MCLVFSSHGRGVRCEPLQAPTFVCMHEMYVCLLMCRMSLLVGQVSLRACIIVAVAMCGHVRLCCLPAGWVAVQRTLARVVLLCVD